ncbi:hypothetical protein PN836_012720 [Ningiella sp. W23]|uniref:hypothetical protein n=1 Tax=Ningiella sp. W23 TaxID=3023715 RepID=UPI003757BE01
MSNLKLFHRQQQGFVLVASIWVMAILVIMVGAFAAWVESSLNKAILQNERAQMALNAASTQSVLFYLAATQGGTPAGIKVPVDSLGIGDGVEMSLDDFFAGADVDDMGLRTVGIDGNEIRLDGTVYSGLDGSLFSIRDISSMLPLNSKSPRHAQALLRYLDVGQARSARLTSTLQDYIDRDDVLRSNGAESFQYTQRGLAPPPNAGLLSYHELQNVLEWESLEALWRNKELLSEVVASPFDAYNLNAVSSKVAQIAFDLSPADAQAFVRERDIEPYTNLNDVLERSEVNLYNQSQIILTMPSSKLRFSFWYPQARLKREVDVHFQTVVNAADAPWIITRDLIVPITESDARAKPREPQTRLLR